MTVKPRRRVIQTATVMVAALVFTLLACDMPSPMERTESNPTRIPTAESGSDSRMVFIQEQPEPEEPRGPQLDFEVREVYGSNSRNDRLSPEREDQGLYINGVRVEVAGRVRLDTLVSSNIAYVEIITGDSAQARFGESAPHSVIHIHTKTTNENEGNNTSNP